MALDKKETKLQDKSTRVKRKRLKQSGPLYVPEEKLEAGFHYRIVNDEAYAIEKRKRMGYEIVQDSNITVGDNNSGSTTGLGSVPSIVVDKTTGKRGILMRIADEEHQEILDEIKEETDRIDGSYKEEVLNRSGLNGSDVYGNIKKE